MLRTHVHRDPLIEICCMSTYIKYFLCKYAGQELYKIFACHMLPLYIFYKHFGTTDCNISGNFEHFSFLDHFEIKRKVKDLSSLLLLLRSSPRECQKAVFISWNHTSAWMFSPKIAAYFQKNFSYEKFWGIGSVSSSINSQRKLSV